MNVSGVLVIVSVPAMAGAIRALGAVPGVEVHHTDPATGRIVVTVEGESIAAEVETLKRIKALPDVVLAEMVHHHFEEDDEIIDAIPEDLGDAGPSRIPHMLEDGPVTD